MAFSYERGTPSARISQRVSYQPIRGARGDNHPAPIQEDQVIAAQVAQIADAERAAEEAEEASLLVLDLPPEANPEPLPLNPKP